MKNEIFDKIFQGIKPIHSGEKFKLLDREWFVSKTGIMLQKHDGNHQLLAGFSCSDDFDESLFIANCELVERLYSTYEGQEEYIIKHGGLYSLYDLSGNQISKVCHYEDIIVGGHPSMGKSKFDASGLAWHTDLSKAISHGLSELLERHFLCELWWGTCSRLISMRKEKGLNNNITAEWFILELDGLIIPLSICILSNFENTICVLGSSFHEDIKIAEKKSLQEALMLNQNLDILTTMKVSNGSNSNERIKTLNNPDVSKKRLHHLYSKKVYRNTILPISSKSTIDKFFSNEDFTYSKLSVPEGYLIRINSDNIRRIRTERKKSLNCGIVSDPFC